VAISSYHSYGMMERWSTGVVGNKIEYWCWKFTIVNIQ